VELDQQVLMEILPGMDQLEMEVIMVMEKVVEMVMEEEENQVLLEEMVGPDQQAQMEIQLGMDQVEIVEETEMVEDLALEMVVDKEEEMANLDPLEVMEVLEE